MFYNYAALSKTPLSIKWNAVFEEIWWTQQVHYGYCRTHIVLQFNSSYFSVF